MNTPQLTHEDSTRQLTEMARNELLKGIAKNWARVEAAADEINKQKIEGINAMRAVGEGIKAATQHELFPVDAYVRLEGKLPKSMNYRWAHKCVLMSNLISEDVKTIEESNGVQQTFFSALNGDPRRQVVQVSHERNTVSDFISWSASFNRLFEEYSPAPMEQWRRDELETFYKTTNPIAERNRMAAKLLGVA